MRQTFGPIVFHPDDTGDFEARCYSGQFDCAFRIGDTCTHAEPSRKIEGLPETPDWCEMKASALADARGAARSYDTPEAY